MTRMYLALLLVFSVLFNAKGASGQEDEAIKRADDVIDRARKAYSKGQYIEAIQDFQIAEEIVHDPNTAWNVMRCYEGSELYKTAIQWLDRYSKASDINDSDRQAAKRYRIALQLRDRGVKLVKEGNHREALLAFLEAETLATFRLHHYYVADCYRGMGEHEKASTALSLFEETENITVPDREKAKSLRHKIGEVRAASSPPSSPPSSKTPPAAIPRPRPVKTNRPAAVHRSRPKRTPIVPVEGVRYRGTAFIVQGRNDIRQGSSCTTWVTPADSDKNCRVRVICQGRTIYGAGRTGYNQCRILRSPGLQYPQLVAQDTEGSYTDGDPMLSLAFPNGPVTVSDRSGRKTSVVTISSLVLERTGAPAPPVKATRPPAPVVRPLTEGAAEALALQFYSTRGEFAGQHRISISRTRLVRTGPNTAEARIRYRYTCIRGYCRGRQRGRDQRVFQFQRVGTQWNCTSMGPSLYVMPMQNGQPIMPPIFGR